MEVMETSPPAEETATKRLPQAEQRRVRGGARSMAIVSKQGTHPWLPKVSRCDLLSICPLRGRGVMNLSSAGGDRHLSDCRRQDSYVAEVGPAASKFFIIPIL